MLTNTAEGANKLLIRPSHSSMVLERGHAQHTSTVTMAGFGAAPLTE